MKNVLLFFLLIFFSCKEKPVSFTLSDPLTLDSLSSCPFVTSDLKGNPVVSYVTDLNDSVSVMRYRVSFDHGKNFQKAIEIPSSRNIYPHPENLPKIIFKPSGEIIGIWGSSNANPQNKYSGLIFYASSFDEGRTWSEAKPLVTDSLSFDQRYFDVDLLPNGEAGIIWLDNRERTKAEGSTIFFSSTNGSEGFKDEVVIAESICPCCRTELFIDKKGIVHAAFRDIINDSIRDMVYVNSVDNGKTFSLGRRISADNWVINGCPHTGPTMTETADGLHFSWYTGGEKGGVYYCNSKDSGLNFSQRDSVSQKPSAKHPQITAFNNRHTAIVWDETVKSGDSFKCGVFFQLRSGEGKIHSDLSLAPDSLVSEFPVIRSTGGRSAVIAFSQKNYNNRTVCVRTLNF